MIVYIFNEPQLLIIIRIVFHVLSFKDFNVFRATIARTSGNLIQLLTSQTLAKYDFPPIWCFFATLRYGVTAFAAACFHADETISSSLAD